MTNRAFLAPSHHVTFEEPRIRGSCKRRAGKYLAGGPSGRNTPYRPLRILSVISSHLHAFGSWYLKSRASRYSTAQIESPWAGVGPRVV